MEGLALVFSISTKTPFLKYYIYCANKTVHQNSEAGTEAYHNHKKQMSTQPFLESIVYSRLLIKLACKSLNVNSMIKIITI